MAVVSSEFRNQEEHQADEREIQQMTPGLGRDKTNLGGHVVLLINLGGGLDVLGQKLASAAAVEFQFLDAFGEGAKCAIKFVFLLAGLIQEFERAADDQAITDTAEDD